MSKVYNRVWRAETRLITRCFLQTMIVGKNVENFASKFVQQWWLIFCFASCTSKSSINLSCQHTPSLVPGQLKLNAELEVEQESFRCTPRQTRRNCSLRNTQKRFTCLEAHSREPKLNKGTSNSEGRVKTLLLFERFLEWAPKGSALRKNFSKVVLSCLIRPLCSHARSGPLTPGQGWSGRYFRGDTHAESLAQCEKRCEHITVTR